MARTAELKVRTTHDGSQAEASIKRLQNTIEKAGNQIAQSWTSKVLSVFGPTALLSYLDSASAKTRELTKNLREAKTTLAEMEQQGISQKNAEFTEFSDKLGQNFQSSTAGWGRRMLTRIGFAFGWPLLNEIIGEKNRQDWLEAYARATFGPLGDLGVAESQNALDAKLKNRGGGSKRASSLLKSIIGFSPDELSAGLFSAQASVAGKDPATTANVQENAIRFSRSFSNLQRLGAYAYSGDPVMQVQRDQLKTLRGIERLLKAQNRSILEADSGVMFPP